METPAALSFPLLFLLLFFFPQSGATHRWQKRTQHWNGRGRKGTLLGRTRGRLGHSITHCYRDTVSWLLRPGCPPPTRSSCVLASPAGRGARWLAPRRSPRQCCGVLSRVGGHCPRPSPGQHSEYSSVDFSHLGRGTGAGGRADHNPVLRAFEADTRDRSSGKCFANAQ